MQKIRGILPRIGSFYSSFFIQRYLSDEVKLDAFVTGFVTSITLLPFVSTFFRIHEALVSSNVMFFNAEQP